MPTRIRRLREEFDAIVLTRAGMALRASIPTGWLSSLCLTAIFFRPPRNARGPGARPAANCTNSRRFKRSGDEASVEAERRFSNFGGGCHVPLGALAYRSGDVLHLSGLVASVDGKRLIRKSIDGGDPALVGRRLAEMLKEEGADALL